MTLTNLYAKFNINQPIYVANVSIFDANTPSLNDTFSKYKIGVKHKFEKPIAA